MIKLRFVISILLLIIVGTILPVFAGEYKVLVLPNSSIDLTQKNKIGTIDLEEMLAKKIISRLEETGMACAPTVDVLKISILNNPFFVPKASNPVNNAKIISDSYKVPKVLLISSKVIVKSQGEQKDFWKALNIPAISQTEANFQLITTVTMYDMKTDQVLWNDVYQQNLNQVSEGIKSAKITVVNSYYDELTEKLIKDLKATKSTSAILVSDKFSEGVKTVNSQKSLSAAQTIEVSPQQNIVHPVVTKVKLAKMPKESSLTKIKLGLNKKISEYKKAKENKKIENAEKLANKSKKLIRENEKLIKKSDNEKQISIIRSDKKENKVVKNLAKTEKSDLQKPKNNTKTFTKKIVNSVENAKKQINNYIEKKNLEKANKLVEENKKSINKKEKAEKPKIVKNKEKQPENKTYKLSINKKIKDTIASVKQAYTDKKTKQIRMEENAQHYTTVAAPVTDDEFNVNSYIQVKPRNNAWSYTPKFNSLVNDI